MKTANAEKKPSKLRRMFGSRFKAGSYSAFAAAVVIAIAVLVNLAVFLCCCLLSRCRRKSS